MGIELLRIEKLTERLCSPPFEIMRQRDAEMKKGLLAERQTPSDQTIIERLIESIREDVTQPTTEDRLMDRITGRDQVYEYRYEAAGDVHVFRFGGFTVPSDAESPE